MATPAHCSEQEYHIMVTAEQTIEQQNEQSVFDGFNGLVCREDWFALAAFIDNLAEFKIVEWLLRHTWDEWVEVTTEVFMHGYYEEEGLKIDYGTGMSKPSVLLGIKKAVQHGLIEQWVDETDKTRIRKFYRIRVCVAVDEQVEPQLEQEVGIGEPVVDEWEADVKDLNEEDFLLDEEALPPSMEISNNSNYPHNNITCENISRIQEMDILPERCYSNKSRCKSKYPAFLRSIIKELSIELGDGDHIGPNISHATRLYKQSGLTEDQFIQLLYDLKALAFSKAIKKKNKQGGINRMPYVFTCLTRSVAV
jgi:hypothetical protein